VNSEREQLAKSKGWSISRIELFVVLLVIFILVAMLLPAIQQVRTAARRTESSNNLRQIALGAMNFESAHMKYPAGVNYFKDGSEGFGWALAIVSFMESNNLYSRVEENEPWDSIENSFVVTPSLPFYTSPLEDESYNSDGYGVLHYAACSELISGSSGISPGEDFDHTQFMFGEICDGYEPWAKPGSCRKYGNGIGFDATSFGSPVLGGALMARANGKVEFINSTRSRPAQTFVGKSEQGVSRLPDGFGYEVSFAYSPTVKGWRANCWFAPNSKGYGGGKSSVTRLNIGLRNLMQDEDLKMLHGMDQLQCLRLTDGEFSNESIEKLRQALPDCEVIVP